MRILYHVMSAPPPLGLLFLAATERGLRYVEFMDRRSLRRTIAAHADENPGAAWEPSVRELRPLAEQIEQYFCGTQKSFRVPLDPAGSEHQRKVWQALSAIPYGETRSYGEIAKAIGEPRSARAVGLAANQNPLAIVVPCHRVIGADGKLVGYNGGLPRKKALLGLEARFRALQDVDGDRVIEQLHVKVTRPAESPRAKKGRRPGRAATSGRPAAGAAKARAAVASVRVAPARVAPAVASAPKARALSASPVRRPARKA
jgi:methylated-DNA-[protein]-cysteine S-methyltransferase